MSSEVIEDRCVPRNFVEHATWLRAHQYTSPDDPDTMVIETDKIIASAYDTWWWKTRAWNSDIDFQMPDATGAPKHTLFASRLYNTQEEVTIDGVLHYLAAGQHARWEQDAWRRYDWLPLVVMINGDFLVIDGHHRVCAAALRRETIDVHVVDHRTKQYI